MNAVIVASNRPDSLQMFLDKWKVGLAGVKILLVHDSPTIPKLDPHGLDVQSFCWRHIDKILGKKSWVIPRRAGSIKSFGIWMAWKMGAEMIVVLDDDCLPHSLDFLECHWDNLHSIVHPNWHSTLPDPNEYPRGFPYGERAHLVPVMLSHGLWLNNPDYDAMTALKTLGQKTILPDYKWVEILPPGKFFPMCGMNIAFRREIAPTMYFGLQGGPWKFDRYDDIWCGIFTKKVLDQCGMAATNGRPYISHERASDPYRSLRKETPGMVVNEVLWQLVKNYQLKSKTPDKAYAELAYWLNWPDDEYFRTLKEAMGIWVSLFR